MPNWKFGTLRVFPAGKTRCLSRQKPDKHVRYQLADARATTPLRRRNHVCRQKPDKHAAFAISSLTLARLPRFGGVTMFAGRSRT
ncbi:hypothetical protein, partial [uncultured Mailhella sp.]|uniref:hypothetical protein n=1 Tax=uncultured Mailhella sp. TaxID=1981031 RepID=UPI00261DC980